MTASSLLLLSLDLFAEDCSTDYSSIYFASIDFSGFAEFEIIP